MPTTEATKGQGDPDNPAATTPARNASKPSAKAHQGPLGNDLNDFISAMGALPSNAPTHRRRAKDARMEHQRNRGVRVQPSGSAMDWSYCICSVMLLDESPKLVGIRSPNLDISAYDPSQLVNRL